MALTSCTVPHAGKPTFDLPEDEMEIGIGIHGEPGRKRMPLKPADEIVEMLMEPVIHDLPYEPGDRVLLFVNGMGGTPLIELYIAYRKAHQVAEEHGLTVSALPGWPLYHQPGNGRHVDHAAQAGRAARAAVGCPGPYSRPALGDLAI